MNNKKKQTAVVAMATVLSVTAIASPLPVMAQEDNPVSTSIMQNGNEQQETAPPISLPENLTAAAGTALKDVVLPEDWIWEDDGMIVTAETAEYPARFSVDDVTYDYTETEGYNAEGHYVECLITVTAETAKQTSVPVQGKSRMLGGNPPTTYSTGDIAINQANFPDRMFRIYLTLRIDTDKDGSLSAEEIANVKTITIINTPNITDLTGIEHFTALTELVCYNTGITSLDISQNTALTKLYCYNTGITSLDVSQNKALTELYCNNTGITSLDVSQNKALTELVCDSNPNLTSLRVAGAKELTKLYCSNTGITSLDISQNTALTKLYCNNTGITNLDVSQNTALTELQCYGIGITSLDVSQNKALTRLYCHNTGITSLDVSQNKVLTDLVCNNTGITSLDVSQNTALTYLYCYNTGIKSLDVSQNTVLTYLNCSYTVITSLDVSQNTALTELYCNNTGITSLDVSKNKALTGLACSYTRITSLDVGQNTALTDLNCNNTGIASLDVSQNTALTDLDCTNTGIKSLDVSQNTALTYLYCYSTGIKSLDVSKNIALTELGCFNTPLAYLNIGTNNLLTTVDKNNLKTVDLEVTGDSFKMIDKFSGIDKDKISNVSGATYDSKDGTMSGYSAGTPITYTYACGTSSGGTAETINVKMMITLISSISVTADLNKPYDGTSVSATPVVSRSGSTAIVSYKWERKKNETEWEPISYVPKEAGTYRVTATLPSDNKYKGATSTPAEFVISQAVNNLTEKLSIKGWTYGDTANEPTATARFGKVSYIYSNSETGKYTDKVPSNAGTWYVKAVTEGTDNYTDLESDAVSFAIAPKDITSDSQITMSEITADTNLDELVIIDGKKVLIQGTDYDITKTQDGNKVTVTITAKGNYTGTIIKTYIVEEKAPSGADDTKTDKKAVQTGDTTSMGLWSTLLVFSAGLAVFFKRKKHEKETNQ